MNLQDLLTKIEELDKNATSGLWKTSPAYYLANGTIEVSEILQGMNVLARVFLPVKGSWNNEERNGNAEFIAESRTLLPKCGKILDFLYDGCLQMASSNKELLKYIESTIQKILES